MTTDNISIGFNDHDDASLTCSVTRTIDFAITKRKTK